MIPTRHRDPTAEGTSIYAGTVGIDGSPIGCRGIALVSKDDLRTATVYVPMATSRDFMTGLAASKRLAIVSTYPPDHGTTQVKGTTTAIRLAADDERELLRQRLDKFAEVLNTIGYPLRVTRAITYWPAFAIELKVDELFEQTPGPKAGTLIR